MKIEDSAPNLAVAGRGLLEEINGKTVDSFSLATGSARVYARATDVDLEVWRAAFGDSRKDFEYYRLIEETMSSGFVYRYLVLLDEQRNPIALQPLVMADQDLAATTNGLLARAVGFVRKILPRFFRARVLMAGCLVGDDEPGFIAPANRKRVSESLAEALLIFARRENISLLTLKDFPAAMRDDLAPFESAGYIRLDGFPPLVRPLDFSSFDEYVEKRLSRATRKNLRRKLRKTENLSVPITMEVLTNCGGVIDEVYPLYVGVARRAPVEFEIFSREYFVEAGKRMPGRYRYFVWRRGGKIIAFSFCTIWNGAIYDNDIGFDYEVGRELHLYYRTYRDVLVWSLENGLKEYHCSPFNYDPKARLRMKTVDVDLYVRHTSTVINALLKWIAPWFSPVRSDPVLREQYAARGTKSSWKKFLKFIGNPWLQIALNAIIVTISELFLKIGARNTAHLSRHFEWSGVTGLASIWTWLGIVFVILSLLSWLYVLRQVPLSVAFPLSNVVHVLVPLSCWIFLGELISPRRWWGIALVLIGLLVVAKPFSRIEEQLDEKL